MRLIVLATLLAAIATPALAGPMCHKECRDPGGTFTLKERNTITEPRLREETIIKRGRVREHGPILHEHMDRGRRDMR